MATSEKQDGWKQDGWIAVDFDGVLAVDDFSQFPIPGAPIPAMVARVRRWIDEGKDVRIFTARVGPTTDEECQEYGYDTCADWTNYQVMLIEQWCQQHLGCVLPITATKDFKMRELWDDRCVQMTTNTGQSLAEEWEARLALTIERLDRVYRQINMVDVDD